MNNYVIQQIAKKSAQQRVGQSEPLQEPKPGFFQFDPEWARLKRMYILKDNWYELYKESEQFSPPKLKQQVRQAYASFKSWVINYETWTDVAFSAFPEALYKQTVEYSKIRNKVLPYIHSKGVVSKTIPGKILASTPPLKLSSIVTNTSKHFMIGLLAVGAFWILMQSKEQNT